MMKIQVSGLVYTGSNGQIVELYDAVYIETKCGQKYTGMIVDFNDKDIFLSIYHLNEYEKPDINDVKMVHREDIIFIRPVPNLPTKAEDQETMVEHPPHYKTKSGLETIDVIEAFTADLKGMEAVCTANAIKYLCRWKKKNGVQDLKKANRYINHLIDILEKERD